MITYGTEENFNELINKELVIVDFFATWCGPCKMLGPVLEELANERAEYSIVKVDVDQAETLAKQYGIMSVPTVAIFKNGEIVTKRVGFMTKDVLTEWIEENR